MNPLEEADLEQSLDNLSEKILKADAKLTDIETKLEEKRKELRNFSNEKLEFIQSLDYKRRDLESKVSESSHKLKTVNKEVSDRQIYLLDQEATISQVTTEWNEQLSAIRTELSLAEADRTRVLKDIVRHEQRRDDLVVDIDQLEDKKSTLTATYEERAKDYRLQLQQLDTQLKEKNNQIDELGLRTEIKNKSLTARENAAAITESILARTQEELQQKERKLRLDYRLAGETY